MDEQAAPQTTLDEQAVADYLRSHPDFLLQHIDLLETLQLRHDAGGAAVSLIERQVEVLRARGVRLEDRLLRLIETARDNERRALNIQRLARALIRAPALGAAMVGLRERMREDFDIEHVFVGVMAPLLKRSDIDGLTRIDPEGPLARHFENFLRTKLPECGPIEEDRARLLFPKLATLPASAAIVPLEKDRNLGMLVLASPDPERFQPRQGKLFLEMAADLVAAAIRARLT